MRTIKKIMMTITAVITAMSCTVMPMIVFAEENIDAVAVDTNNSTISVVLVYQSMSRTDYLDMYNNCYDEAKKQANEYAAVLDTAQYTEKEISDMEIAYFEETMDKVLADNIKSCALYALSDLDLDETACKFDSVYPIVYCNLTEKQLKSAENMNSIVKIVYSDEWITPEEFDVMPFDYVEQSNTSSTVLSDKLMAEIDAGKQTIEATMLYKDIDLSEIIQEVRQKGEEYQNSLDPNVYTPDEINEMTGAYKENLNAELINSATATYRQTICDYLGIKMENVTFIGNTRMICTLTPEQIYTAAESDWLDKSIILREEFVSVDDLGYTTTLPTETTMIETTTTTTTTTTTITPIVTTDAQGNLTSESSETTIISDTSTEMFQSTTTTTTTTIVTTVTTEETIGSGEIAFKVVSGHGKNTSYLNEEPIIYRNAEELPQSHISDEDYAKYDAAFFEDNALIYLKLVERSGSITETIKSIKVDENGIWHINVESYIPEKQTADMMEWVHYITVPNTLSDDTQIVIDCIKVDANGNQLPQTGYSNIYKIISGFAILMTVTGTVIVIKTRKESK